MTASTALQHWVLTHFRLRTHEEAAERAAQTGRQVVYGIIYITEAWAAQIKT